MKRREVMIDSTINDDKTIVGGEDKILAVGITPLVFNHSIM